MTVEEFRKTMAETKYIPAGSELHQAFHAFSQEALKITAERNGPHHIWTNDLAAKNAKVAKS